jgi:hypothetical protein
MTLTLDDALEAAGLPKVMRIASASTYADVEKYIAIISGLKISRIILGVRKEELNGHALVLVAQARCSTFLMDTTSVHMQRLPRLREVENIFQNIQKLGLLAVAEYCQNCLPATSALPVQEALDEIIRHGKPVKSDAIVDFETFQRKLVVAMPHLEG